MVRILSPLERDGFDRLVPLHEGQGFPKHRSGPSGVGGRSLRDSPRGEMEFEPRSPVKRTPLVATFCSAARISLSRETEGFETVSSRVSLGARFRRGPRPCMELISQFCFSKRRHASILR